MFQESLLNQAERRIVFPLSLLSQGCRSSFRRGGKRPVELPKLNRAGERFAIGADGKPGHRHWTSGPVFTTTISSTHQSRKPKHECDRPESSNTIVFQSGV